MPFIRPFMQRISINVSFCLFLAAAVVIPQVTMAHELSVDGVDTAIGAVMHVDPNDNPHAGEQARLFFEFKDEDHLFNALQCNCSAEISKEVPAGQASHSFSFDISTSSPGVEISDMNISFPYTFSEEGTYKVVITGKPKPGKEFDSFKLPYEVTIAPALAKTATSTWLTRWNEKVGGHLLHFIIFIPAILIAIILVIYDRVQSKKRPSIK